MPYDWYDYQRKVTSDETMKESSDYLMMQKNTTTYLKWQMNFAKMGGLF